MSKKTSKTSTSTRGRKKKAVVAESVETVVENAEIQEQEQKQEQEQDSDSDSTEDGGVQHQEPANVENEPQPEDGSEQVQETENTKEAVPEQQTQQQKEQLFRVPEADTKEMMEFCGLQSIPREHQEGVWARAIAKVLKRDASVSWCVLVRTPDGEQNIEKVFGRCSPIHKLGTPIPIEIIPHAFAAVFPKNSVVEMTNFLVNVEGLDADKVQAMSKTEMNNLIDSIVVREYMKQNGKGRK